MENLRLYGNLVRPLPLLPLSLSLSFTYVHTYEYTLDDLNGIGLELHNVCESFMRVSVLALGRNFSKTLQTRLGKKNETKRETLQRFKRREESRILAYSPGWNRGRVCSRSFRATSSSQLSPRGTLKFSPKVRKLMQINLPGTQPTRKARTSRSPRPLSFPSLSSLHIFDFSFIHLYYSV